jgi:hypothetical protein
MVLKGHGDIRILYHDDGVKVAPHANGTKDQQGRKPAPDRKRSRFTQKAHERQTTCSLKLLLFPHTAPGAT